MFRKIVSTYLLLAMAAVATGGAVRAASAAPAVELASARAALPAAAAVQAQAAAPAAARLSAARMGADQGAGIFGWLKKIWKKYKKQIIKIIWQIIQEIINTEINETQQSVEGISGTVAENYEGTDTNETVYASQADYDASNVQSTSATDGGYAYVSTDYSSGCYCGGEY